ncbi:MAG: glycosyltransferase family 4 protein [Burkholderiaceae bacterium]
MNHSLLVAPSLAAGVGRPGQIRLTGKFIAGMQSYVDLWGGPVILLIEPDPSKQSVNLDDVWVRVDELPFKVVVARFDTEPARRALLEAGVVMGGTDHRMNHAAATCKQAGVPFVMVTEYSLKTRLQIVDSDDPVFWRRWRRRQWAIGQEKAIVASIRQSAGLQCNGTPTYEAYRHLGADTLLYFDSRVSPGMIPDAPALAGRTFAPIPARPLRLAFSGRLNPMKGADHLLKVATALRELGVPFRFDIWGDGPLRDAMVADIARHRLEDAVFLPGVLDFASELMPRMRAEIDLFVCCHRQGDPSCTYLETMACGVPIVGYDNEAFAGLMRQCPAGRTVPMDNWQALAGEVARLASAPQTMIEMAQAGLEFARKHTFEAEFLARIDHMKRMVENRKRPIPA